jgi:hypothetical protein
MEAAMGESQTASDPMEAIREHLKAIQTESARLDLETVKTAALAAQERLKQRPPDPLPSNAPTFENCMTLYALADASYDIAAESTGHTAKFFVALGDSVVNDAINQGC